MALSARSRPQALDVTAVMGRARFRFASRLRGWVMASWQGLARGRALPAAVSTELAFERGERVLAVGRDPAGGYALIATDRALHHRDLAGGGSWSRLGWEQIARAGWDAAGGQLVIAGMSVTAPSRTVIPLRARGTVPEVVQERITHTRLGRWYLPAAGTRRVLIEARRRPVTGELLWFVAADAAAHDHFVVADADGHDHDSCDTGRQVERAIARLCADLGLTHLPGAVRSPDGPPESQRPLPMFPRELPGREHVA